MNAVIRPDEPDDRVNILLVDDQPARLLSYESILAGLGQNLVSARSGTEALECMMREEYALVLLDVSMPGMDGFETAAMIHDHPRFERTPIIFVTGVYDTEFDRLKGYKLGAVDYVSIPVVPEILRSKVAVLVELHCKRRELQKLNLSLEAANRQLAAANTTLQAEKTRELQALNLHLKTANDELGHAIGQLQEQVAERSRAETALKEADRRKDEFLAILAHELRNPLAPIRNAVTLMSRLPIDNPELRWSREIIDRQVEQLTRLVDDLLDISRITSGLIRLAREPVPVQSVLEGALEAAQPSIAAQRHSLVLDIPGEPMVVIGDQTRLVQMVGNLLNNAARYTNPGGRIEVSVKRDGDLACIAVRDNGIGIAAESLTRLFQLFSRIDSRARQGADGLGVGLALVRRLADMHGGEVSVHSEGLGMGSEFVLRLPLAAAAPALADASPAVAPAAGCGHRILVADDNRDALDTLAMLLESEGHEVFKAADGAEALLAARTHRPELILLDIGMPVMDGYQAAVRIRGESWGGGVMLVALTGWGQSSDVQRAHAAGFDLHLVKPVTLENLQSVIARVPAYRAKERDA